MKVPGYGVPTTFGPAPNTETYFATSATTSGSSPLGPWASMATVFRMPKSVMTAESSSASSGKVTPRRRLKSASTSCES